MAILIALFVTAEGIARAIEPGPFTIFDSNPYIEHPRDPGVHRHVANFTGRWDGTWYATNSLGLRGPELELTMAPTEYRVVTLGDSCTFGKGVLDKHSWPRQLEWLLGGTLGTEWRAVVANLGVNGYSGKDYERIFREVGLGLRPHLVVVGYNLNDFPNTIKAADEHVFRQRGLRKFLSQDARNALGRLASFRWLRQTYYQMKRQEDWAEIEAFARGAGEDPVDSPVWQEQEGYLASIKALSDEIGAKMLVFLFPYESQVYLDAYDTAPVERLRGTCDRLDVPFVDLANEFRHLARETQPPRELFLRGDRYHPNADGYYAVARRVVRELVERRCLPGKKDEMRRSPEGGQ